MAKQGFVETVKGIVVKNINKYGIHFELLNSNYYNFETLYDYKGKCAEDVNDEALREVQNYKYNRNDTNESTGCQVAMFDGHEANRYMSNHKKHKHNNNNNTVNDGEHIPSGNRLISDGWNMNGTMNNNMHETKGNMNDGFNVINMSSNNSGSINGNGTLIEKNELLRSNMLKCVDENETMLIDINDLYKKTYKIKNLHLNKKKRHLFVPDITEEDLNNDWPYNITVEIIFSNMSKFVHEMEECNMNMNGSPLKMRNVKHVVANKMHLMSGGRKGTNIHNEKEEKKKYLNVFRPYKLGFDAFLHFKEIKITTYYKYINDENMYYHIWNKNYDRDNYSLQIKTVDISYELRKTKVCNFQIKNIEKYSYYCHNMFLGVEWKMQLEIMKYKLLEVVHKRLNKFTSSSITSNIVNGKGAGAGGGTGGNINDTETTAKPSIDALKYLIEESEYCFYIVNTIMFQYKQLLKCFVNLSNTYFDYYQNVIIFKCMVTANDPRRHSFWLFLFIDLNECFKYASLIHGVMEVKIESVDEEDQLSEECKIYNDSLTKKLQQYISSVQAKPLDISHRVNSSNIADLIYAVFISENYNVNSVRSNFGDNLKNLQSCEKFISGLLNENIIVPVEIKNTFDDSDQEKNIRTF